MVTTRSRRGSYLKGLVCRERLEWAAIRVAAERGVAGATVEAVAEAAGVTKGAAYWHYRDKQALLLAASDRALEAWTTDGLGAVLGLPTAAQRVGAVIAAHVDQLQQLASPALYLTRLAFAGAGAAPHLRQWRERLRLMVGASTGAPPVPAQHVGGLIHGLLAGLLGLGIQWEALRDRVALETAAAGLARGFAAQLGVREQITEPYESVLF